MRYKADELSALLLVFTTAASLTTALFVFTTTQVGRQATDALQSRRALRRQSVAPRASWFRVRRLVRRAAAGDRYEALSY